MSSRPKFLKTAPDAPAPAAILEAALAIKAGGTVVYPTRCLYGLGTDAFNNEAVRNLYSIKQRSVRKPILILIDRTELVEPLVSSVTGIAARIMKRYWPGKITLVFEAADSVSTDLTGGSKKIGIRQPGHPTAAALVKAVGRPVTGTSANISGTPGCHRVDDLQPALTRHLDLILDVGPLAGGRGSTVVDVTTETPQVLREGVVPARDIMALAARRSKYS